MFNVLIKTFLRMLSHNNICASLLMHYIIRNSCEFDDYYKFEELVVINILRYL